MKSSHVHQTDFNNRRFQHALKAIVLILVPVIGCNRPQANSTIQLTASAPTDVKFISPKKNDVRRAIERPGLNVEPYERTALYAKIPGYVQKWNVDIGRQVHKDDVLAELAVPEMDMELQQKEAVMRQAAAEIEQAKAVVLRTQAELDRAKSQYDRMSRVGRGGVLDKEQVDESRLGYQAAQAAAAKAHADVLVAESRLDVAKADRDRVQSLLQYTKIRAPFDGVITNRSVNTGALVQPSTTNKEALYVIEKVVPIRVVVNIQELEAILVREGDAAVIRPQGHQGLEFTGKVARTSSSLNPQTRTLRCEIDLPNPQNKLLPGMFVNVTIFAEHKNVWTLSASAVSTQGEQPYCFRVDQGRAVRLPIQIGLRNDKFVEVLKKGTGGPQSGGPSQWSDITGDEVIVENANAVKDGAPVQSAGAKK